MASNNNGFAEAAKYFANKLKPKIKASTKNKQPHLRDSLKVVVKNDRVSVEFKDEAWYWYLVEHGHKKANGKGRVKGKHFVQNTFDAEGDKIADIMAQKIIDRM